MQEYALLSYKTPNIGDDIQSLAARQFLPRVDCTIDRDQIGTFKSKHRTKLIMNGWFTHNIFSWPPAPAIEPLMISVHAAPTISTKARINNAYDLLIRSSEKFGLKLPRNIMDARFHQYYREHAPIGCRDLYTLSQMRAAEIDAYFSGCLTLTLKAGSKTRKNQVVFVDPLGDTKLSKFQQETISAKFAKNNIVFLSHNIAALTNANKRLQLAQEYLDTYAGASLVITSRLHCALPCLAFGTPVLYVNSSRSPERLGGLLEHLVTTTVQEFSSNPITDDLLARVFDYKPQITNLVESLEKRCKDFISAS